LEPPQRPLQIAPRYGIVRTRMGMSTRIAFWFGDSIGAVGAPGGTEFRRRASAVRSRVGWLWVHHRL